MEEIFSSHWRQHQGSKKRPRLNASTAIRKSIVPIIIPSQKTSNDLGNFYTND